MRARVRDVPDEFQQLPITVFDARDHARREEAVVEIAVGALDAALVRGPSRPAKPWLHPERTGDLEQARVVAHGVAVAREYNGFGVIEKPLPRDTAEEHGGAYERATQRLAL
jgi:hypothetical protein